MCRPSDSVIDRAACPRDWRASVTKNVLLVSMRHDYGIPERGDSYEYVNLYLPLSRVFPGTQLYDFMDRERLLGREAMNAELSDRVARERPDVTIIAFYTDQLLEQTVVDLRRWTTTVGYFFDDIWRRRFAEFWARRLDVVATPDAGGVARYRRLGLDNAVHCPFSFNEEVFRPRPGPYEHEISFVGGWHPYRAWILKWLSEKGYSCAFYGAGWPAGRLSVEDMARCFSRSKINLNLDNGVNWDLRYSLSSLVALKTNLRTAKRHRQVKGRHFEIAGSGGFQITYDVAELNSYFDVGREIVTYGSSDQLLGAIRRHLSDDEGRKRIAERGERRAWTEHTARRRLMYLVEGAASSRIRT